MTAHPGRLLGNVLGLILRAGNHLMAPPTTSLDELLDGPPHDGDCLQRLWQATGDGPTLSLVTTTDGRLAVFAADMEDFVAVRLTRAEVQSLRHAVTGWLVGTAEVVQP